MALHLHDNDGTDDQHLIPGEGMIDWVKVNNKLKAIGYKGAVALEVTNEFSNFRDKETPEEFLERAAQAAEKLQW